MSMRALQWEGWKKELKKMMKKKEERRSYQALGSSESALRLGVFSPWLDSFFIADGVDLGLMPKKFPFFSLLLLFRIPTLTPPLPYCTFFFFLFFFFLFFLRTIFIYFMSCIFLFYVSYLILCLAFFIYIHQVSKILFETFFFILCCQTT